MQSNFYFKISLTRTRLQSILPRNSFIIKHFLCHQEFLGLELVRTCYSLNFLMAFYHQHHHCTFFFISSSIVISNYKDFPGYTDNVNGPTGVVVWTVRGYIHCIYGDVTKRANLMPVDYCINALIATAWDIHEKYDNFNINPHYSLIFTLSFVPFFLIHRFPMTFT